MIRSNEMYLEIHVTMRGKQFFRTGWMMPVKSFIR